MRAAYRTTPRCARCARLRRVGSSDARACPSARVAASLRRRRAAPRLCAAPLAPCGTAGAPPFFPLAAPSAMAACTLYHCAGARSLRVLWALREAGARPGRDYRLVVLPFPPRAFRCATDGSRRRARAPTPRRPGGAGVGRRVCVPQPCARADGIGRVRSHEVWGSPSGGEGGALRGGGTGGSPFRSVRKQPVLSAVLRGGCASLADWLP